jgi:hypothetical protein
MRLYDGDLDAAEMERLEAALHEDEQARGKLASIAAIGTLLREKAEADTRGDGIADLVMAKLDSDDHQTGKSSSESKVHRLAARPANDNARNIFGVAMLAAAAAAALFVWGRTQPGESESAKLSAPLPVAAEMPSRIEPSVPSAPAAQAKMEEVGVEIASVDFGTRQGSVFYVAGDDAAASTTVVWIDDTSGGEK